MPRYQIVFQCDEVLSDDEIENLIQDFPLFRVGKFIYLYSQSLEGIRKELWEKKEILLDKVDNEISQSFDEIKDLFKLD